MRGAAAVVATLACVRLRKSRASRGRGWVDHGQGGTPGTVQRDTLTVVSGPGTGACACHGWVGGAPHVVCHRAVWVPCSPGPGGHPLDALCLNHHPHPQDALCLNHHPHPLGALLSWWVSQLGGEARWRGQCMSRQAIECKQPAGRCCWVQAAYRQ